MTVAVVRIYCDCPQHTGACGRLAVAESRWRLCSECWNFCALLPEVVA